MLTPAMTGSRTSSPAWIILKALVTQVRPSASLDLWPLAAAMTIGLAAPLIGTCGASASSGRAAAASAPMPTVVVTRCRRVSRAFIECDLSLFHVCKQLGGGSGAGIGLLHGLAFGDEDLGGHAANVGDVEVATGALGGLGVAVADDLVARDVVGLHHVCDELGGRVHLRGRGAIAIEVADEADADGVLVVPVVGSPGVRADLLLCPAGADFDQAVGGVGAVADDEVVAEFVPAFFAML